MNIVGFSLTFIFAFLAFSLPRPKAALAVFAAVCYITQGQMLIVGGFHFTAIRIVLLIAILRGLSRGETKALRYNPIDRIVIIYVAVSSLLYILRQHSVETTVGQIGIIYNVLFSYFAFRFLLPTYNDMEQFLSGLALLIVPMAGFLVLESINGRNFFYAFGGVNPMDELRDGHYRCSAAFRSPITAGTFGATVFPLFVGLYFTKKYNKRALIGIIASTLITLSSRSSGPALEYGAALLGMVLWRWRQHTKLMRRGLVVTIVSLQMIMKAPVWFLMGRISDVVGGGGWHRAEIVDAAVNHFRLWWLWGTNETGDWVATQLSFGGADLTNQFVAEGVNAGLPGMLLFIAIIVRCFKAIGLALAQLSEESESRLLIWSLGAAVMATIVNFFSVSYFDQIHVVWWCLVAIIASSTADILAQQPILEGDGNSMAPSDELVAKAIDDASSLRPV